MSAPTSTTAVLPATALTANGSVSRRWVASLTDAEYDAWQTWMRATIRDLHTRSARQTSMTCANQASALARTARQMREARSA
jgi:hypothetical protein